MTYKDEELGIGGSIMMIIVLTIAGFIVWQLFNASPSSESIVVERSSEPDKYQVYEDSKMIVSSYLKSPSTAEFSPVDETTTGRKSENTYQALGYVDSQNGFGAMIRSNWGVEFTYVGSAIKVDTVIIDGKKVK